MNTITKESLVRYLETSSLTEAQKKSLMEEFERTKGSRDVLNKAVNLNHGQVQRKVTPIPNRK